MELSKNTLTVLQDFYGRKTLVRTDYQHAVDICSAIKLDKDFINRISDNYRTYLTRCQGLKISPLNRQRYTTLAKLLFRDKTGMCAEIEKYWSEECIR